MLPLDELYERVADFWPASAAGATEAEKKQVLALVQDRMKTLTDLPVLIDYFFAEPTQDWTMVSGNKQLKKLTTDEIKQILAAAHDALETVDFTPEAIQNALNHLLETTGQKPGILFSLIRLAVSWAPFSPALNDTLAVLGRETSLRRIQAAIDSL